MRMPALLTLQFSAAWVLHPAAQAWPAKSGVPDSNRAYSWPDGSLALIVSCDDASASAYCTVEFPSQPKEYGRYPYEIAQRSAIVERVKDCKAGSVRFDSEGKAVFVPGTQ